MADTVDMGVGMGVGMAAMGADMVQVIILRLILKHLIPLCHITLIPVIQNRRVQNHHVLLLILLLIFIPFIGSSERKDFRENLSPNSIWALFHRVNYMIF